MAFPETGILDDFNRGDEDPLTGVNWTTVNDNDLRIVSNQCVGAEGNQHNFMSWNTQFGPDTEAYVTIVTTGGGGTGVYARFTTQDDSDASGYELWLTHNGEETQVWEWLNGDASQIGSGDEFNPANGDKFGGDAIGTTLRVWIKDGAEEWAVNTTETDGTTGGAGYTGLTVYDDDKPVDDFGAGTLGAAKVGQVIPVLVSKLVPLMWLAQGNNERRAFLKNTLATLLGA